MTPDKPHITSRRGFIAAMGFGGVGLYGLWAAYGAAPGPLTLLGIGGHAESAGVTGGHRGHAEGAGAAGGHGGHGGHGAGGHGPTADEFSRMTADFIERYRLPDGTVYPRALGSAPADPGHASRGVTPAALDHGGMDHGDLGDAASDHAAMDHGGSMDHGESTPEAEAARHAVGQAGHDGETDQAGLAEPREVLLAAGKWYYQPHALRLDAGQAYRFRMMAVDVSHGASIQFGNGGRMVRLRPGRLTEMDITFKQPGRYLVYCTVYCGPAHDYMQATIEVVA